MDKLTSVKNKIIELWKTHLHPKDFKSEFQQYLDENSDWTKTKVTYRGTTLKVILFEDDNDGYEIKVSLKKPDNVNLK